MYYKIQKGLRKRLDLALNVKIVKAEKLKHLLFAIKKCLQNITTCKKNLIFNLCKIARFYYLQKGGEKSSCYSTLS